MSEDLPQMVRRLIEIQDEDLEKYRNGTLSFEAFVVAAIGTDLGISRLVFDMSFESFNRLKDIEQKIKDMVGSQGI